MNPASNNGNEPPPEDEDRSLLFGPRKEGTEPAGDRQKPRRSGASASPPPSRTSPPAADAAAEPPDPAGRAGPAASSDAVLQQILAQVVVRHRCLIPRNRSKSTCYHADRRPNCGLNNMRLVLPSDTHGLHRQIGIPDGDVPVRAGDFCSEGEAADPAHRVRAVCQ